MKKLPTKSLLSLGLLLAAGNGFATQPGGYFGIGAGYLNVNIDKSHNIWSDEQAKNASGFGGRFFYGYNFNQNIGLEIGYTKFNRATSQNNQHIHFISRNQKATYNNTAIDLVAKLYTPINNALDFYILGGASYMHNQVDVDSIYQNDSYATNNNKLLPKLGLGTTYNSSNNWSIGAEFAHIFGDTSLNSTDDVPGACMALVTLSYKVG